MPAVRLFQDPHEKKRRGPTECPWSVEWRENGRRRSKTIGTKLEAQEFATVKRAELVDRARGVITRKTWPDFLDDYDRLKITAMRSRDSQYMARRILRRFGDLMKPRWVYLIDRRTLDEYVAKRLAMTTRTGDPISPETIKKELRYLRAALNVAVEWRYLASVPKLPRVLGHTTDKRFVNEADFNKIMAACDAARLPDPRIHQGIDPAAFWRALLATAWISGMRIGALLALRWEDADLEHGNVWSRSRTNKGKRDMRHNVAPARALLEAIRGDDPRILPWNHNKRTLWTEFARIQTAAGIHLPCPKAASTPGHVCTDACHLYGFHDLRRAHATYNYGRVDDRALQQQMGHASFQTTQQYIKYAEVHAADSYPAHLPESIAEQRENSGKDSGKPALRIVRA